MADITLSKAVRSNLLNLQSTADLMGKTQERLATGKKVNSALDNPTNFFTASSLDARASDMSQLLDSMANGIQTLEAADNGLTAITKTLESMQSTLTQARQDKSFKTASYSVDLGSTPAGTEKLSLSDGAIGSTAVDVDLTQAQGVGTGTAYSALDLTDGSGGFGSNDYSFDIATNGGTAKTVTVSSVDATHISVKVGSAAAVNYTVADSTGVTQTELTDALNTEFAANGVDATVSDSSGKLTFTAGTAADASDAAVTINNITDNSSGGDAGLDTVTASLTGVTAKSVDTLVSEVNANTSLDGKVRASNDNGKLRIENLSTQDLTVTGATGTKIDGGTGTGTIGGNTVRSDLATQYNTLRDQLDKLSDDASFNGINLLRGDNLQITFNETGTSQISIQAKDGKAINSTNLGIDTSLAASELDSDSNIDSKIDQIKTALGEVRSQASSFGSNLSVVQNRQDFTKNMINTLQTGASNLTLADTNEEAANLLALQTRQQLSSTALSLASQADQNVLRLF